MSALHLGRWEVWQCGRALEVRTTKLNARVARVEGISVFDHQSAKMIAAIPDMVASIDELLNALTGNDLDPEDRALIISKARSLVLKVRETADIETQSKGYNHDR